MGVQKKIGGDKKNWGNLKFHQMSSQMKVKEILLLFDLSKRTNKQTHRHTHTDTHTQANYLGQLCVEIRPLFK